MRRLSKRTVKRLNKIAEQNGLEPWPREKWEAIRSPAAAARHWSQNASDAQMGMRRGKVR